MKLLEIKNNLIKLSYTESENPILGRFLILATSEKSYVAQFVNLKSDNVNNFAIAKLLFTFTSDGVVDNYDGSIPSMGSELSFLSSSELLDLLPVETPIKFGLLAQQEDMLNLDISVFERNFTVFAEQNSDKSVFISNCVRQLFQMKEKCIIIDTDNMFEDYTKIAITKDFKLPLNSKVIEYLFNYELADVDASTKAIIQDIFYDVEQYIKTLDFEFIPIDSFVDVVAAQYKETQMPELALLKNKLLKYSEANVFANTKEEVLAFNEKLSKKNCSIIDIKCIQESLQKEVILFIHNALKALDKYSYFFVSLTDGNSDKKLLQELINNNHVFTTLLVSHSYKYASELKSYAENIVLFAPQTLQHDFATYNTFLNKLNLGECIVYGKLTQGIPFIVDMSDLDLDLTKEDVLGEKYQFVPTPENLMLVKYDENGNAVPVETPVANPETVDSNGYDDIYAQNDSDDSYQILQEETQVAEEESSEEPDFTETEDDIVEEDTSDETYSFSQQEESSDIIEPVANIMEDSGTETEEDDGLSEENFEYDQSEGGVIDFDELQRESLSELTEEDLDFIDDNSGYEEISEAEQNSLSQQDDGEDYIEADYTDEQPAIVPVYPAESEEDAEIAEDSEYKQGDSVSHPRYGRGVVEKIIKYGNKTLCSISFENVGRRLLDPTVSEFTKM